VLWVVGGGSLADRKEDDTDIWIKHKEFAELRGSDWITKNSHHSKDPGDSVKNIKNSRKSKDLGDWI